MRLSELSNDKRGREYRPKLGRVRAEGWRDLVRVKMVKGQAPEQWELHASGPGALVQRRVMPGAGDEARPARTRLHSF